MADAARHRIDSQQSVRRRVAERWLIRAAALGLLTAAMPAAAQYAGPTSPSVRLYRYNAPGTVSRETAVYTYDALGRPTTVTYASGVIVSYTYDAHGNVAAVSAPGGTTRYVYDAQDRVTDISRPDGTREILLYDALGNIIRRDRLTPLHGDERD